MANGVDTSMGQGRNGAWWSALIRLWTLSLDLTSHERLVESILRRIMRIACLVAFVSIAHSLSAQQYYDVNAQRFSVATTTLVFAATFLPVQARVLSLLFPTMLVFSGVVLAALIGPRIDPFLVLAGGMFIGALVLSTRLYAALTAAGWVGILVVAWRTQSNDPAVNEVRQSAITTMVAVVVPTTIAGRVLVAALVRTLKERQRLLDEVVADREALHVTVRDLEATRTQLTHAQKLELMSQLAGGIAHDMNNALTAIIGEASLLGEAVSDERERILEAGEYAAKLTHQLMVFARRDTSQPKPTNIVASLGICCARFGA